MFHVKHYLYLNIKTQDNVSRETYNPLDIVIAIVKHFNVSQILRETLKC